MAPHRRTPEVSFLQLDDLKVEQLPQVAFVTLETSPGKYQAWLALPGRLDKDYASRVRKGAHLRQFRRHSRISSGRERL
jgi:hypothetical protein